ncbi:hypothetical protein ASG76_12720 [Nocardioides sp. Soil774]|uniref:hypothetical protein n=1 Tax=Nocardioides sp. Soil774 TaxID=1736408 RepID=UPI0006F3ED85|nr:hypothetical protein [Nocardioides sp. Soil774]KRE94233.1 hypothetical protein ASG76_12720 [Nocardioides sp. Soil774]
MSSDDRSDLVAEMYALVREQAPLHEVTHEVRDLVGGTEVVHGPWQRRMRAPSSVTTRAGCSGSPTVT